LPIILVFLIVQKGSLSFLKEDQSDHGLILGTSQTPKIFFGVWQASSSLVRMFCSLWYLLALTEYKTRNLGA